MLGRPDFMAKQMLFIESDNSKKLRLKNSNIILTDENNEIILQHPCTKIFMVFILGEFSITSVLIKNAKKYAVPIVFLNYNLKPYFSILPDNKGNFLLRKKQYANSNDLEIAKHIVSNKVKNQINLMNSLRYKTTKEKNNISKIKELYRQISHVQSSQELLGVEGTASKLFFETYFKNLDFNGRKPRCKDDIFNLLLDIGYYYLFNFIEANLELYGFDTYCGFYHKLFFQRKSLVCDLVEPFRCIIDRRIRKSFNLKQINKDDFYFKNGQFYVKREFNKKYSKLFLKEILLYKEKIFLYIQSYYRSFIKGKEIDSFPVFNIEADK
ncbi:MAG: type V CRISPR-associated endonuclease Cas1 [Candidatus Aenigmarchaeota archaeon]|nr:type V CRISPR-associated endonuclease Cas1 [Candidatus Aenigmarchaeota archaeon]